ncbi:MAG: hypothetical protein HYV92_10655 [Candidatus Rokubacteria bacterium]|nr:hypothetical protein [Candidatus Rokubacteria bacterium]MBI2554846.1 hypothetical protein [Candidatus Rokubacteria bacterium]
MTVTNLIEKFARLEAEIAQERGDFTFFALFMREDVPDRWDLIISAPWVGEDKRGAVDYLVAQIKSRLGAEDLICLSRIVPVDPEDVAVKDLNRSIQVEHGNVEVRDSNFFGLAIKRAHIITSKPPPAPATR